MLKLFLWLRYLRKKKIVLLSIVAVALSVALMVVADSIFSGYIEALGKISIGDYGDITLWPAGCAIRNYELFLEQVEAIEGVESAAPFISGAGLLWVDGGDVREVSAQGISARHEKDFGNWQEKLLRQGKSTKEPDFSVPEYNDLPGAWLGINVIAEPNETTDRYDFDEARKFIGRKAILITTGRGQKRKVQPFRVSDIAFTDSFFGDRTIYMPFEESEQLWVGQEKPGEAHFIKVKAKNGVNPRTLVEPIKAQWHQFAIQQMNIEPDAVPELTVQLLQDWHNRVFEDLRNQLTVVLLIFGVICSVAVLLIFCIFYMIVTAKQKDIAIIKSCGASGSTAAAIFAGFGACVGIVGSLLGVVLGVVVTKNVNVLEEWVRIIFGIKLWRTSSYGLATIPHQVNWANVPPTIIAAIIGCVIGVLIPAIIAARTRPVEILRYE